MEISQPRIRVAIYGSGGGSNAQAIIDYFRDHRHVAISLIISNLPNAYILQRAQLANIPSAALATAAERSGPRQVALLKQHGIDIVALAGYSRKVPTEVINVYPNRILNIHPALLPAYGGKGMFGLAVHQAVVAAGETETGVTIHYVDEAYDEGRILVQARLRVAEATDPNALQQEVLKLEHRYYPVAIEAEAERLMLQRTQNP